MERFFLLPFPFVHSALCINHQLMEDTKYRAYFLKNA